MVTSGSSAERKKDGKGGDGVKEKERGGSRKREGGKERERERRSEIKGGTKEHGRSNEGKEV